MIVSALLSFTYDSMRRLPTPMSSIRKSAEDAGREPGGESRQPKAGRGGRGESLLPLKDGDQIQ
ncbi:MAG: hypothetical protein AB7P18_25075, partial [Candidatus Binatia bacterium]